MPLLCLQVINTDARRIQRATRSTSYLVGTSAAMKVCSVLTLIFLVLSKIDLLSASKSGTECALDSADGTCAFLDGDSNIEKTDGDGSDECRDSHDQCPEWAENGECVLNTDFMFRTCRRSCSVCHEHLPVDTEPCVDEYPKCDRWEIKNQCVINPYFMLSHCRKSCKACPSSITHTIDFGVRQKNDANSTLVTAVIRQSKHYMRKIMAEPTSVAARELCRNGNELCSVWAAEGECKNPAIQSLCAPACQSCDMIDINKRCEMDPDAADALSGKGDLTKMFEQMMESEEFSKCGPRIIYQPYKMGNKANPGPWFISFENFLSDEEIIKMIEHGERRGYGKSEEVTIKAKVDGTYEFSASSYKAPFRSWCDKVCEDDPVIRLLMERISNLTGLPQENAEPFQFVRYSPKQEFGMHHDYIEYQKFRPCGVRLLTFTFYLNDDVEGGETYFRLLHNKTFAPKKGKALLWTNVLNNDPNEEDVKLDHESIPVITGEKFTANLWFHQRDYKNSFRKQCS